MANGHAAAFAITIEQEDIIKQGFDSLVGLVSMLYENNASMNEFAQITSHIHLNYDEESALTDEQYQDVSEHFDMDEDVLRQGLILYGMFRIEFHERYSINITLDYHSDDDGDIYDAVSDAFFTLDFGDVYQVTDKAKAMQEDIPFELSQFVVYG